MIVIVLGLMASFLVLVEPARGCRSREARSHPWPPGRGRERQGPVTGRAAAKWHHVVLQRSADGRWVKVRRVPVHEGTYQVTVPVRPKQQRFRVRAGVATSQIRIVAAGRPTKTQDACGKRPWKADRLALVVHVRRRLRRREARPHQVGPGHGDHQRPHQRRLRVLPRPQGQRVGRGRHPSAHGPQARPAAALWRQAARPSPYTAGQVSTIASSASATAVSRPGSRSPPPSAGPAGGVLDVAR